MNRFYAYRMRPNAGAPHATWLVCFTAQGSLPVEDFWDLLTEDVGRNLRPEAIIFIAREDCFNEFALRLSEMVAQPHEWRVSIEDVSIALGGFSAQGQLISVSQFGGAKLDLDDQLFARLKEEGLRGLFHLRDGLIRPSPSTHFVHPSGKHSRGFIRVSNLMIAGPEVMFISMTLLSYLPQKTAFLWVDTSSIASVAYATAELRRLLDQSFEAPVINSFSSWQAVRETFKFPNPEETFLLISATTSGRLASDLMRIHRFNRDQIVTLYSLAPDPGDALLLCNLLNDPSIDFPATDIGKSYREGECALCEEGSNPVHFVGDQFLADDIRYSSVIITAADAPANLETFMANYYGQAALRMRASGPAMAVNTFFLHSKTLINSPRFLKRFQSVLDRHVPASTGLIAYLDGEGSEELAAEIKAKLPNPGAATLVSATEIRDNKELRCSGSVAITAASIASGSSLQSLSRDLRDPCEDRPRIFLIGFLKYSHLERSKLLLRDLAYSSTEHKHHVHVIENLILPQPPALSAWEAEVRLLSDLLDPLDSPDATLSPEAAKPFSDRLDEIAQLSGGAVDGFFWAAHDGTPLRLRRTFAFWKPGYDPEKASQGDVLTTIASVLENMRCGHSPKLLRTAFHYSLIAPATFGRYNDGIIQASILRTAHPYELNYAADPQANAEMSRLLRRLLAEWENPRGEAATEFLTALATGRLRLFPGDVDQVVELPGNPPAHLQTLAALASKRFGAG